MIAFLMKHRFVVGLIVGALLMFVVLTLAFHYLVIPQLQAQWQGPARIVVPDPCQPCRDGLVAWWVCVLAGCWW